MGNGDVYHVYIYAIRRQAGTYVSGITHVFFLSHLLLSSTHVHSLHGLTGED